MKRSLLSLRNRLIDENSWFIVSRLKGFAISVVCSN